MNLYPWAPPSPAVFKLDGNLRVVIGNEDGYLYCFYGEYGSSRLIWKYNVGSPIRSSPAVANVEPWTDEPEIVFGADDGCVYVLDYKGKLIVKLYDFWSHSNRVPFRSSPAIAEVFPVSKGINCPEIIIGNDNNLLYCFSRHWYGWQLHARYWLGSLGCIRSSPSIADLDGDGKLEAVVGDDSGRISVIELNLGNYLSAYYDTGSPIKASPAIADIDRDGKLDILIGSNDRFFYWLNYAGSGKIKVFKKIPTWGLINTPAVIGNIYNKDDDLEFMFVTECGGLSYVYTVKYLKDSNKLFKLSAAIFCDPSLLPSFYLKNIHLILSDVWNTESGANNHFIMSTSNRIFIYIAWIWKNQNGDLRATYHSSYTTGDTPFKNTKHDSFPIIYGPSDSNHKSGYLRCTTGGIYNPKDAGVGLSLRVFSIKFTTGYEKHIGKGPFQVIKWGMFGSGDKHNFNSDNRYAIIIGGSHGDNNFVQNQFKGNLEQFAYNFERHQFLQDHIYYTGVNTIDTYYGIEIDKKIENKNGAHDKNGKSNIFWTINQIELTCDSYDSIIFYYSGYGIYYDYPPFPRTPKLRVYLFDANNHHSPYSPVGDLSPKELANKLDRITCRILYIILSPSYSGNWINSLKGRPNRIIVTSEKINKVAIFSKCNLEIFGTSNVHLGHLIGTDDDSEPLGDGEEYDYDDNDNDATLKYRFRRFDNYFYEIDKDGIDPSDPFGVDFYEDFIYNSEIGDCGDEFIKGFMEAFYVDYMSGGWVFIPGYDHILDADQCIANGNFNTFGANNDDYISIIEAYKYMKLWHFGFMLNKSPWIDNPQLATTGPYTRDEYLFY